MELNLVKDLLEEVKPGVFTSLIYTVECPVKSEWKKQGIKVRKTVRTTARFKINYRNIKTVQDRLSEGSQTSSKTNNFVPIVKNALYHNTNTDKDYLNVYPIKSVKPGTLYEIYFPCYDSWVIYPEAEVKESGILIDSYFNKKATEMYRINVENIFSIKGRWA